MKESFRRPILFTVIVITGSVLILFDFPLIILIPIVLFVGFVILILLGAITFSEIKTGLGNLKPANLKKIGIFKKLDEMKFFEKSTPGQKDKIPPTKTESKQPVKAESKKTGIGIHFASFVSSLKSLGTVLKARNKSEKKVDEINKQLDKTVREKVERSSALSSAGNIGGTLVPSPTGGTGTTATGTTKEQDPFLSLSEDEFDAGLLDSLDDLDSPQSSKEIMDSSPNPLSGTRSIDINESDIPLPSLDIDGAAGDILKDNAEELEEFSGLDGGDSIDSDFGDLDSLSLDDIDIDEDTGQKNPQSFATPAPEPVVDVATAEPKKDQVKTEWVKSDAPKNAGQSEDQVSTHADMAVFSGGGGGDADLLSSLASDVKHVKKEKNISLLRELKDFKAPATEIDSELSEVYTRMNAIKKTQKKETTPPEGIK
ncbi:MAG: hypothetical protein Q8R70_08435 [Methanoregula sp.]|nr:hypothetical protein [Methanoregula sp.]